jgi:hypothetical protein
VLGSTLGLLVMMVPLPGLEFIESSVGATVPLPEAEPISGAELAEVQAAADEPLGEDRVEATAEGVREFALMAVVFDRPPTAPVMVRAQTVEGGFGEWQELRADADEGPDVPTNFGTEPFWVGAGDGYEVNLSDDDAAHADVVLVRNELRRTIVTTDPVAGAASPPFGVNTRDSWGARPVGAMSYGSTVKLGVVHHSDSGNDYSAGQVPGILRGIQAYHMDGRGWSDIAYNFVVDKYGGLWEGRAGGIDRPVVGAHAQGFNTNTVGVMVLGNYLAAQPSGAAIESVSKVIGWKMSLHGNDPAGSVSFTSGGSPRYAAGVTVNLPGVVGHGDTGATSCPGSIANYLPQIRQRSQEWTNWVRLFSGPQGTVDAITTSGTGVTASGWVHDLDAGSPTWVRLDVLGASALNIANQERLDVQAANPAFPANTGFTVTANIVRPGYQDACVVGFNQGNGTDKLLGCRLIFVADPPHTSPVATVGAVTPFPGGFEISGWGEDPEFHTQGVVNVEVDGSVIGPARGLSGNRFYGKFTGLTAGRRRICVVLQNFGNGWDTRADCEWVDIPGSSPMGSLDVVSQNGPYVSLAGWAFDPEAFGPTTVRVVYDNIHSWSIPADQHRADVGAVFPYSDSRKGFTFPMNIPKGNHTVCVVAVNAGVGTDTVLGCRNIVVK